MFKPRGYLKESEWNYAIALAYYEEYYSKYLDFSKRIKSSSKKPPFSFDDIEYFTVDYRRDGLTEIVFYNKNNEYLFSDLD